MGVDSLIVTVIQLEIKSGIMRRRRFLCGAAGIVGAGLAGCSALSTGSGGDSGARPFDAVEKWLAPPAETSDGLYSYTANLFSLSSIFGKAEQIDAEFLANLHDAFVFGDLDVDRSALENGVIVSPGDPTGVDSHRVTLGSFDSAAIASALDAESVSRVDRRGSWDLFASTRSPGVWIAVTDGAMAFRSFAPDGVEQGRAVVDAIERGRADDAPGLFDREGPHRTVHDRLPQGDETTIKVEGPDSPPRDVPRGFTDVRAYGESKTINDRTSGEMTMVYEFATDADVDRTAFDAYQSHLEADDALTVEYDVDGTTVEVSLEGEWDALP